MDAPLAGNYVARGTVISFDAVLWQAKILLDGADVEATIPVGQWVTGETMTVDALVAVLIFGETNTNDGLVVGPYGGLGSTWTPWTTFAPTLTQGAALTFTNTFSRYMIIQRLAVVQLSLAITSAGTLGSHITVASLPAAIAILRIGTDTVPFGTFQYKRTGVAYYNGIALPYNSSSIKFIASGQADFLGAAPNFAAANGENIGLQATYEI